MGFVGTATSAAIGWLKHATAAGSTLLNDLVSYWTLDEQSGTRADSVGSNDLTDNNTVGVSLAGPSGTVASFAEANAESLSTSGVAEPLTTAATWSFWVKESALAGYKAPITKWTYSTDGGWALQDINGGVTDTHWNFFIADAANDPGNNYFAVGPLANLKGSWHLHTFVYDGGLAAGDRMKFYLDGVEVAGAITGTLPTSIRADSAPYRIGDWSGSIAGREWDGLMGRVGIWSRAFDASDVAGIFNSGVGKSYADLTAAEKVDLVSYWNLDEVSGTRADSHGANDLTDNNTVGSVNSGPSGTVAKFVVANSEFLNATANLPPSDSQWTAAVWFRNTSDTDYQMLLTNGTSFEFRRDTGAYQLAVFANGGYTAYAPFTANEWHLAIGWQDGTRSYLSIDNGASVVSASDAGPGTITTTFRMGARTDGYYWAGDIGSTGIWSRVLSSDERTAIFNSGIGKKYADLTTDEKVGLVSYWDLTETSGDRADSHGANTLTDNNSVLSVINAGGAMSGGAASFVAANSEHLSSAGGIINTIVPDTSLSISFWLKLADADFAVQFRQGTTGNTTEGFSVYYEAPNLAFSLTDGTHENRVNYAYSGNIGSWHHILFQWDKAGSTNGTVTVYVDNVVNPAGAADLSYMPSITDTALHIGAWQSGTIGTDGLIDEVAIWNRVLTSDERTELWNAGAGKFYDFSS